MMNLMNCKYFLINPTNYKVCKIKFTDSVIIVMFLYAVVVCLLKTNCLFELCTKFSELKNL